MNESIHGERTAAEPQDRVTELIEQQTAISEVLRAIASSPHDLQPIFDAILDSATRLCRADIGTLRLSEEGGARRKGEPSDSMGHVWTVPAVQEESDLSAKRSGAAMYAACFSRRGLPRRDAAAVAAGPDVIR